MNCEKTKRRFDSEGGGPRGTTTAGGYMVTIVLSSPCYEVNDNHTEWKRNKMHRDGAALVIRSFWAPETIVPGSSPPCFEVAILRLNHIVKQNIHAQ